VYGVRRVWRQLLRDGVKVARCTVARLMKVMGLEGVRRGRRIRTTQRDDAVPCPLDRVKRQFQAERPNALWVADFTYCWTWSGFVYVAFVTDVFARRIVGWRVWASMRTDFVLDALNQALHDRQPPPGLIHHSDHGSQYLSIGYTVWWTLALNHQPELSATPTTMLWPKRSTACIRPKLYIGVHGARSRTSSSPRSNGFTGITTIGCSARSGTYRLRKQRRSTIGIWCAPLARRSAKLAGLRQSRGGSLVGLRPGEPGLQAGLLGWLSAHAEVQRGDGNRARQWPLYPAARATGAN